MHSVSFHNHEDLLVKVKIQADREVKGSFGIAAQYCSISRDLYVGVMATFGRASQAKCVLICCLPGWVLCWMVFIFLVIYRFATKRRGTIPLQNQTNKSQNASIVHLASFRAQCINQEMIQSRTGIENMYIPHVLLLCCGL